MNPHPVLAEVMTTSPVMTAGKSTNMELQRNTTIPMFVDIDNEVSLRQA